MLSKYIHNVTIITLILRISVNSCEFWWILMDSDVFQWNSRNSGQFLWNLWRNKKYWPPPAPFEKKRKGGSLKLPPLSMLVNMLEMEWRVGIPPLCHWCHRWKIPLNVRGDNQYFIVPHRFRPESSNSTGMASESPESTGMAPEWHRNPPEWYKIGILDDYEG